VPRSARRWDTGALTGSWHDGKFVLSHFDGARPLLLEVAPAADNTLAIVLRNSNGTSATLTAYRPRTPRPAACPKRPTLKRTLASGIPTNPSSSASPICRDTSFPIRQPLAGKVVVIDVAGSWCPNCHDEAPFLQSLYSKYHGRGLGSRDLEFRGTEQYANPVRLRAFVRDFGLQYTVLLAGTLDDEHARLPQAVDLDATHDLLRRRDGLVKSIHAGFAAAATGSFNTQLKQDFTATIEKLLR